MIVETTLYGIKKIEVTPPPDRDRQMKGLGDYQVVEVVFTDTTGWQFSVKAFSKKGPIEVKA